MGQGSLVKRTIAVILAIILTLSLENVPEVNASLIKLKRSGDWMYYVENGHTVLSKYVGTEKKVVIPSKLGGYKVREISYYVFSGTKVTSVTVPSTVEDIEELAFSAGTDSNHFLKEGYIAAIKVDKKNKHYTSVAGVLFSKDKKTLVAYPQGKEDEKYKIPSGVETIGEFAFENCRKLKEVVFPGSVESINNFAFWSCRNLNSISLNNGLLEVGYGSFQDCKKLETITIPKTVVSMATINPIFDGASSLESINVHPDNKYYTSVDGVLFDKRKKMIHHYPEGKKSTSYTVPNTVETIRNMGGNPYLEELTLPSSLREISGSAFSRTTSLTKVKIKNGVEKIGEYAFSRCINLKQITIPKSVKSIGECAFEYCYKLQKVIFKTKDCTFYQGHNVIPEYTVIHGYTNSTAYKYAKNYGRTFVNIKTGSINKNEYSADKLLKLLPKPSKSKCWEPVSASVSYENKDGSFGGYQPAIIHEYNTSRKEYKNLKNFTHNLVKGCKTDKQKIETVSKWVHEHIDYRLGSFSGNTIESVYAIFKVRYGNCMCYTQLTNYMLYLEGISTASIIVPGHEMSAAYDGEKWYVVDSTSGYIGSKILDEDGNVEAIVFASGRLTFDIRSTEGVYLAAIGYDQRDQAALTSLTIPSYVKGIYEGVFNNVSHKIVVKGTKGGSVEKYCKKKFKKITYSGNKFSAKTFK